MGMKIFISGEIDASIQNDFRNIRNEIEEKLKVLEGKDYGEGVESLGIIPIIVNVTCEMESAGFFKERKLYSAKKKDADYRLRINYNEFIEGDYFTKKLLVVSNIIKSVRLLGEKVKKDFQSRELENDILNLLGVDKEMIMI